jgi:hypothetical protein
VCTRQAFAAEVRDEGLSPSCAEALGLSIRRVLAQTHNAQLSTLYLLRPRTIPKTTSGKIARLDELCRDEAVWG